MAENGQVVDVHQEDLACSLSAADQITFGRQLASAQQELEAFRERKKKALLATLKAEETGIIARIAKLAATLTTGEEVKPVTVEGFIDYDAGKVVYKRRDTGVVVRERGILPTERQPGLPLGPGGDVIPFDADGRGVPRFETIPGGAGEQEHESDKPKAIRAELCGHITAVPTDGTIPKLCKTCCPDGDETAGPVEDAEPRKTLPVEDYADEQPEPEGEPDEEQVTGDEPDADDE